MYIYEVFINVFQDKKEPQDVSEKLKTLKGLSEDVSESDLLRCRIEQQAELIYILKQRADEYLKKYMEIEDKTGWCIESFVHLQDLHA